MTTATRPFNDAASDAADEDIYAAHEKDCRPNALFDEHGNRLKLDATDPAQECLREEWFDLYELHGGEVEDPDEKPDTPSDIPVVPCPKHDELMLIELREVWDGKLIVPKLHKEIVYRPNPSARRQWVNLYANDTALDAARVQYDRGRTVKLQARVMWKSGKGADLAGHSVRFAIEGGAGNRNNLIETLGHAKSPVSVTTGSDGWTETAEMTLSTYGGDRFTVRATLGNAVHGGLVTGEFTIWRKMFYEVETMRAADGTKRPDMLDDDVLATELQRHFVEPERIGEDSHPPHKRIMEGREVDAYVKGLRHKDANNVGGKYLRYLFCDIVVAEKKIVGRSRWVPRSGHFRIRTGAYILNLDDPILDVRWKHFGDEWRPFPKENITFNNIDGKIIVYRVDVSRAGVVGLDPKKRFKLKMRLRALERLGGFQSKETLAITTNRREPDALIGTCIHEIGHAFGIPARIFPDGKTNESHVFTDGIHSHCAYHTNKCVLYFAATSNRRNAYCPDCSDCLRGRDLNVLPLVGVDPY